MNTLKNQLLSDLNAFVCDLSNVIDEKFTGERHDSLNEALARAEASMQNLIVLALSEPNPTPHATEPLGTEENATPYATAVAYGKDARTEEAKLAEIRGYSNLEACRFEVITSDLYTLPLCIVSVASFEEMCDAIGMWAESPLSPESHGKVYEYVYQAKAPNDGLLGTCVTEQFTLPELSGMRIHIQIS